MQKLNVLKLGHVNCGAYVKHNQFVCAKSDYKLCRHDRTVYHQVTTERPRNKALTECKNVIRHLNGTDNP